ncbi:MAG: nitrous oxide reductase, partial [Acidobacteriota bacterium]
MQTRTIQLYFVSLCLLLGILFFGACQHPQVATPASGNLASRSYVPVGEWDKYYGVLSGGQSGSVNVYGLPSGRYIRSIPVYEPRA